MSGVKSYVPIHKNRASVVIILGDIGLRLYRGWEEGEMYRLHSIVMVLYYLLLLQWPGVKICVINMSDSGTGTWTASVHCNNTGKSVQGKSSSNCICVYVTVFIFI